VLLLSGPLCGSEPSSLPRTRPLSKQDVGALPTLFDWLSAIDLGRQRLEGTAVSRSRVRLWHHSPVRQSRPLLKAIDLVQRESVQVSPATRQLMALAQRTLLEKVSPKQAVPDEVWRE
jgi:hypothetical protein